MSEICKLIEAENPMMKVRLSGCSSDLDRNEIEQKKGTVYMQNWLTIFALQLGIR